METPEISAVEISEMPREMKLEMPIEQSESKQVQDVNLLKSHVLHKISLPSETIDLSKTEGEIPVPNRNILGKSISKLHTRQRKILGSILVRKVNPTRLVKRRIPSMCSPLLNHWIGKLVPIMPMKKELITVPLPSPLTY